MSTDVKINALLSLPENFDVQTLVEGQDVTIEKDGFRIMPFYNPMELSTSDHKYLGKVLVKELRMIKGKTFVTFEVLKLFNPEEQRIYTENFIKPS